MLQHKILADVNRADLEALVRGEAHENRFVDYKRTVPADGENRDLAKDIAAFANASGGDIVFGVEEKKDASGKPLGVPEKIIGVDANYDSFKLRVEQIAANTIAPRVHGIQFSKVDGFDGGAVFILRVPRSWNAPHMITAVASPFYSRTEAGNQQLDIHQIRAAFLAGTEAANRIRRFRDERLGRIVAGDTPVSLIGTSFQVVAHVMPITEVNLDLHALHKSRKLRPPDADSYNTRFNLDGIVAFTFASNVGSWSYSQAFRDGGFEGVVADFLVPQTTPPPKIHPRRFELTWVDAVRTFMRTLRDFGADIPVVVSLALVGVRGAVLDPGGYFPHAQAAPIDRHVLVLPDVMIRDLSADAPAALRPAFDVFWQAGGFERSHGFDAAGKWLGE